MEAEHRRKCASYERRIAELLEQKRQVRGGASWVTGPQFYPGVHVPRAAAPLAKDTAEQATRCRVCSRRSPAWRSSTSCTERSSRPSGTALPRRWRSSRSAKPRCAPAIRPRTPSAWLIAGRRNRPGFAWLLSGIEVPLASCAGQVEAEAPRLAAAVAAAKADLADIRIGDARYNEIKQQPQTRWTLREAVAVRVYEEVKQLSADLQAASEERERAREARGDGRPARDGLALFSRPPSTHSGLHATWGSRRPNALLQEAFRLKMELEALQRESKRAAATAAAAAAQVRAGIVPPPQ